MSGARLDNRHRKCNRCLRRRRGTLAVLAVLAGGLFGGGSLRAGDEQASLATPGSEAALEDPWVTQPIQAELPAAPQPFARWIQAAGVSFDFYDPQREPFRFAGETRFEFAYQFRAHTRWQLIVDPAGDMPGARAERSTSHAEAVGRVAQAWSATSGQSPRRRDRPGRRRASQAAQRESSAPADSAAGATTPETAEAKTSGRLEIRVTYEDVSLAVSHRIRLPIATVGEDFFEHPLVRHEFDHVALSGDPKLRDQLRRMLSERNSIIIEPVEVIAQQAPISAAEQIDNVNIDVEDQQRLRYSEIANAAVRRQSDRVFEEFVEGVKIRHRELDRVTSHGSVPLESQQRSER